MALLRRVVAHKQETVPHIRTAIVHWILALMPVLQRIAATGVLQWGLLVLPVVILLFFGYSKLAARSRSFEPANLPRVGVRDHENAETRRLALLQASTQPSFRTA